MGRQYEERVVAGGPGTRGGGVARPLPGPQYAGQSGARAPVLPPLAGVRGVSPPHRPVSTTHVHWHAAHGAADGTMVYGHPPGQHLHAHSHSGDASHAHEHAAPAAGLASAAGGGETRARGRTPGGSNEDAGMSAGLEDLDLGAAIVAYLAAQGVDVGRAVADIGYAAEHAAQDARGRASRAQDLAGALRAAKRRTELAQEAWLAGWSGWSWHEVVELREAEAEIADQLAECCLNDPELVSEARRRAR